MSEAVKRCPKCGQTKRVSLFSKLSSAKDGLNHWCKDCFNEYQRARKSGERPTIQGKPDQKLILMTAIETWGEEHQWQKIAEECTEFTDAWFHWRKTKSTEDFHHMLKELADLFVTGWQGRIMGGPKVLDGYIDTALHKLASETAEQGLKQCGTK